MIKDPKKTVDVAGTIRYHDENGFLHREDGPAIIWHADEEGMSRKYGWWWHGRSLFFDEWKRRAKLKNEDIKYLEDLTIWKLKNEFF